MQPLHGHLPAESIRVVPGRGQNAVRFRFEALFINAFPVEAPPTDWPGSASSRSALVRLPGHAVPSAFLHEQVSERKFRTGRNPRSIKRNSQQVMLYAVLDTMK